MGTKFQSQRSEDAIIVSTQFPANQHECSEPNSKKQRILEEFPSNPSYTRRAISVFFKTRLCVKFRAGSCSNGANCNFAHGNEDLRRPPPNWQDLVANDGNLSEEQLLVKNRICKKFFRGEACSYGERCTFMHVENLNAIKGSASLLESRDDDGGIGQNSESIVVVGSENVYNQKVNFWKTRMCNKWEASGYCPFGDKCHFAHGHAELTEFRSHAEFDRVNIGAAPGKSHVQPVKDVTPSSTVSNVKPMTRGFLKWEGLRKISHLYADWIDDLPLPGCSSP